MGANLDSIVWRKSRRSGNNGGNCVEVGVWRKSRHSANDGGDCVELGVWRKSRHSGNNGGECVEVAGFTRKIAIRDSKDPDGPKLAFAPDEWKTFAAAIKGGGFDR